MVVDEEESKKVEQMLSSFELDGYGKAGIQVTNDDAEERMLDADQNAQQGLNQNGAANYIHEVHEIQVMLRPNVIRAMEVKSGGGGAGNPLVVGAEDTDLHRRAKMKVGGQTTVSHCLSQYTLSGTKHMP